MVLQMHRIHVAGAPEAATMTTPTLNQLSCPYSLQALGQWMQSQQLNQCRHHKRTLTQTEHHGASERAQHLNQRRQSRL